MALEASPSHDMQLAKQIESIKMKTAKLSIAEDPCEMATEEHDRFINKAKQEINNFTQLLREVLNGSLKGETVAPLEVEILDIHWNGFAKDLEDTDDDDDVDDDGLIILDIVNVKPIQPTLEEEIVKLISKSLGRVDQLIKSNEHPSLHDDLKALYGEQMKWLWLDFRGKIPKSRFYSSDESGSESEDEGISDPMLGLVD